MKITYLGHASFLIESKDGDVVFDPYRDSSVPGLVFPKDISADICLCSHEHFDHNAREYVQIKSDPKRITFKSYLIPHDKDDGAKRGMNRIQQVFLEGKNIVHLGDTGIVYKKILSNVVGCDVLFVPINGFFTIDSIEAKEIFDFVKPRVIIPMHYEIKERGCGYPDSNQIDTFERMFKYILKVKKSYIEYDEIPDDIECLVFDDFRQ